MIPNSSLEKTCARKTTIIQFDLDDLIDLLIYLADHGSCKSNDPLVTATRHQELTKHDLCMIEWIDQLFYDFYDFVIFNGFELMIYVYKLNNLRFIVKDNSEDQKSKEFR